MFVKLQFSCAFVYIIACVFNKQNTIIFMIYTDSYQKNNANSYFMS